MKIISDIIAALRANMKCIWLKVFQPKLLYYNPFLISEMKMRVLQMENKTIRDSFVLKGKEQQKKIENRQFLDLDKLCEFILAYVR